MGNNAFAQDKRDEALSYYKKCLELNPKDMDAKYNIEYILNQNNQPKQKQKNKDGKNDKNNKDQKQQSKDNNNDKDKKTSMSKEDAQRILQYYEEQEKSGADKRKMKTPEQPKTDQDW